MKAAIYTRVSTEEQSQEGFSLAAQLNALQDYCLKNNIELYNSYSDEGISGTKEDRPAFQKMLADAEKGLFNVILVHKFDRFARKVEISQRIKTRMKKASVNVISITEPIEDSPIGFFQEGILELLSEYFIKNLSSEIKKGQKQRALEGHHHGKVPYGYRTKDGLAFIVEEEAEVVRQIYELYLQNWGYTKIALFLNESNIKTLTGTQWSHSQVGRILKNKVYCGYTILNGEFYKSKNIPAIISEDKFEETQKEKGVKGERYTYKTDRQSEFLLLGLLKCGECGCAMRISASAKLDKKYVYRNYVCNVAVRYVHRCTFRKFFSAKKMHIRVINYLNDISNGKILDVKTNRKAKVIDIVDMYTIKVTKELQRAKEAYLGGVFDLTEYSQIKIKLEKELKELSHPSPIPEQIDIRDNIKNVMEKFSEIPEEDIISRKKLLRTIIEYISVGKDGMDVYFL